MFDETEQEFHLGKAFFIALLIEVFTVIIIIGLFNIICSLF